MALPDNFQKKILERLKDKGVSAKCELCSHNNWAVADQAVTLHVSQLEGGFMMPPPNIPSAALVCNNCGNIRLLSLGVLGLLEKAKGGVK